MKTFTFSACLPTRQGWPLRMPFFIEIWRRFIRNSRKRRTFWIHREKMAALGELSNAIAHEIKNPLVSIGGFARRLYRAMPEEASEKRYTQTIMTEVARLEKILNDLFNYTHDESWPLKNVISEISWRKPYPWSQEKIDDGGLNCQGISLKRFPRSMGIIIN